jgi:hypothetical protein
MIARIAFVALVALALISIAIFWIVILGNFLRWLLS